MSKRFDFIDTRLSGLYRIERKPVCDSRGYFNRFFCAEEFKQMGLSMPISQMNHTLTTSRGAIRGLHFQNPPYAEVKMVTCLTGEVWDVAVDVRENSPTFLQWHAEILSSKNKTSLYIPKGFAHGFQTLTENCELFYLHSVAYNPEAEGALNAFDPMIGIDWPITATEMSEKDQNHPMLNYNFKGIEI